MNWSVMPRIDGQQIVQVVVVLRVPEDAGPADVCLANSSDDLYVAKLRISGERCNHRGTFGGLPVPRSR